MFTDGKSNSWLRFGLPLCAGLLAFCSACVADPPQAATPLQSLTVQEAVSYALAHYPAVQAAIQKYVAAREAVGLAKTSYLPSVNMIYQDARATRNAVAGVLLPNSVIPNPSGTVIPPSSQTFWQSGAGILLSDEPFDFGYRRAELRVAESTEKRAQEQLVLTRLDVAAAVADASLLVLAANQQVKASQADVDRRSVFAKSVHALVDAHLRPGADASRIDAELAEARTRLVVAQEALQVNSAVFAEVLGLAGSHVEVTTGPFLQAPAEETWTTPPATSHPAAQIGQERVEESQLRIQALTRSYFPRFLVQAVTTARGSGTASTGKPLGGSNGLWPDTDDNWAAGFSVTFQGLSFLSIRDQKKNRRGKSKPAAGVVRPDGAERHRTNRPGASGAGCRPQSGGEHARGAESFPG